MQLCIAMEKMIRQIFMPHPALSKNHILFQHGSFFLQLMNQKSSCFPYIFYAIYFCYLPLLFSEAVFQIFHLFHGLDLEGLKSIKLYAEDGPPNIVSDVYVQDHLVLLQTERTINIKHHFFVAKITYPCQYDLCLLVLLFYNMPDLMIKFPIQCYFFDIFYTIYSGRPSLFKVIT